MDRPVLIVAASGRALAASARRGGFVPLVADYFGDQDMLASAHAHRCLPDGLNIGMQSDTVLTALAELAQGLEPEGVVCGTGFEDRPDVLAAIGKRFKLIGNSPEVVRQVKHPTQWAALCRTCGIPHPEIALEQPADPGDWLVKRHGGAGGGHIKDDLPRERRAGTYYQRRVAGTPVSALFLAEGRRATRVGFSTQWSAAAPHQPFRYGGAVTPAAVSPHVAAALDDVIRRITRVVPLMGINSADFLVDGDQFWLLEINPRPGATFDVFESEGGSLFALHVDACGGKLPARIPDPVGARASAIVYAAQDIPTMPAVEWPDWTADRPRADTSIRSGDPLCTVTAAAATADEARAIVAQRSEAVLSLVSARAA